MTKKTASYKGAVFILVKRYVMSWIL